MKKGFTLIELLAVIIVLAALAAIVVPVTTGITKESKEKTKQASIELYGKAAKQAVMLYEIENKVSPKSFEDIEPYIKYDGSEISCETKILNNDKSIHLDKCSVEGKLVDYSFGKKICTLLSGEENAQHSKYECEVSPGVKYNFYVVSHEDDGTTNLIMDRNICSDGTPTDSEKTDKCLVEWYAPESKNSYGPLTAMDYLKEATKTWVNTNEIVVDSFKDSNGNLYDMKVYNVYARLPKSGSGEVRSYNGSSNLYLFEYLSASYWDPSAEIRPTNIISEIQGYWLDYKETSDVMLAWGMTNGGWGMPIYVDDDTAYGVRPVINMDL